MQSIIHPAGLFVSVAATLVARRLFGDDIDADEAPTDIDTSDDATAVGIER